MTASSTGKRHYEKVDGGKNIGGGKGETTDKIRNQEVFLGADGVYLSEKGKNRFFISSFSRLRLGIRKTFAMMRVVRLWSSLSRE